MPGPGNRLTIDRPPRPAPAISLLSSAEIIPNVAVAGDDNPERWLNGIQYRRQPCRNAVAMPVGCETDLDVYRPSKAATRDGDEGEDDLIATDPVLIVASDQCSTFGWSANDYVGRAQGVLAASEAYAVEHEFWTGTQAKVGIAASVAYPDDQWLAQTETSTTLNGGTSVDPVRAMGILQNYMGDTAGGSRGMIHVPAELFPFLQEANLVRRDGFKYLDGRDNIVVPGAGYTGTSPSAATPSAGTVWMYGTGMVTIRRTDMILNPATFAEATDRANQEITFYGERYYLMDWDRCVHGAVLVELCRGTECT